MDTTRKKILYVITKSNWGGAQRYVFELATALQKTADVVVALGGTGNAGASQGRLANQLSTTGIRTIFISEFMRDISFLREFKAFFTLLKLYKAEKPDVVHLNSSKAGGLGALAARIAGVKKIVFTVHGLPYDEDRQPLYRFLISLATWTTIALCHQAIVLSKNDFARTKRLPFIGKKINLIYNGIGETETAETHDAARQKLGIPLDTTPLIGTIAEFTKNKGLSFLVRAFVNLRKENVDARLCLIGNGELYPSIAAFIKENNLSDRVFLPGFIADADRYLTAFDIFALPSIKEGLPYVILEAGRAGLPVVATAVGGIPEIITDMESGIIVRPFQSKELKAALQFLIENPEKRKSFGTALQEKIRRTFSKETMIHAIETLYTA